MVTPSQAISAQDAASLDKDLMDMGGWSLDQLMELAGLSVSQAGKLWDRHNRTRSTTDCIATPVWKVHPPSKGKNILVVCGPGNNGMLFQHPSTPIRSNPPIQAETASSQHATSPNTDTHQAYTTQKKAKTSYISV